MHESEVPSHELERVAAALAPIGLVLVGRDGTIAYTNRELERLFGYEPGALLGRSIESLIPESFRESHARDRAAFLESPATRAMGQGRDLHGRRNDGSTFPVEVGLNAIREGGRSWVLASVVDISARKRADQRFHLALEAAPSGMLLVDARGTILLVNRETERILGYPREQLIGRSVDRLVPGSVPDHSALREGFHRHPTARPMGAGRDLFARRADGTLVPVEIGLNPIETDEGTLVIASLADLTERTRAREALRASEERFRLLIETVEDYAIYMLDAHGRIESWSRSAERIEGYAESEVLGRSFEVLFPPEDRERGKAEAILRTAASAGRFEEEAYRVRKDGRRYLAHAVINSVRGRDGELLGFAKVVRDVTEQRRLEDQLRHAQKLEAVGALAGGIAHDFNNILSGILGFTELLKMELEDHPRVRDDLERISLAVERGRLLVKRILTFSRKQEVQHTVLELPEKVVEAVDLLRASLPSTIEIRTRFDERTPPVRSDPTLIHQVVLNLATNAAQAMGPHGGRMTLGLDPVWVDSTLTQRHPELQRGLHARLEVSDTGEGMAPEVLTRALEPFFTTKARGEGTGIGLAVVNDIVRHHDGALEIQSEPHRGTRVYVYLPAAGESPRPEPAEAAGARGAGERVALVDDELLLRQSLARLLERLGFQVTVFDSSFEALQALREDPAAFDLLMSDVTMPGLSGIELSHLAHALRPGLPILLMTGFTDAVDPEAMSAHGVRGVLLKPVAARDLAASIHAALGRSPGGAGGAGSGPGA